MKIVKAFSNTEDNTFCLQACVQSILDYYFPTVKITQSEIIKNTGYHSNFFTWPPQTVVWLNSLGLDIKLYSPFDYKRLIDEGLVYLKEFKKEAYDIEEKRGEYNFLPDIQTAASVMIRKNLWINERLDVEKLEELLEDQNTLCIGKTVYEWLDGNYIMGNSHFVVVVKKYASGKWLIQDPGLPIKENRKIDQFINNHSILGDIILIKK